MTRSRPNAAVFALGALSAASAFCACGTDSGYPPSLVEQGGQSNQGGRTTQSPGNASKGGAPASAGGQDPGEGGAAGDAPFEMTPAPLALFPDSLEVDVSCGGASAGASLQIRNGGAFDLVISEASVDGGYAVQTALPLRIPGAESGLIGIAPPAVKAGALVGDESSGRLSFETNEPGAPSHTVTLTSKLLGAVLEFTDHDGAKIGSSLTLSYKGTGFCPDAVKYRVHNAGNLAVTLIGPSLPAHFSGTGTGASGQVILPDESVELSVTGVSLPGNACSASGLLSFSTSGSLCGDVPVLHVVWPISGADWPSEYGPPCSCPATEQ